MSNELNIQLDPFSNTGLTLIARVYAKDGTEQTGSPVTCSEVASALYTGDFALAGISDDAYSVRFETNTPDELYGTGKLFVRNGEEVTQEGFFNSSLDEVTTDTASRDASKADVTGLSTFDPATDPVANVTLVDTTTTNTDMRGTDGANTTTPPTASEIDTELSSTHGAASWEGGSGGDDAATIYTYFTDGTREDAFKADVSGLSTFDPASDSVANVTTVQTTVSNTDMRGTDLVPTNPLLDNDARLDNLDTTISSRSDFDNTADEVITDSASRDASKADVSGLSTFDPITTAVTTNSASRDASKADVSLLGTREDLEIINIGVQKASKLKTHRTDLPYVGSATELESTFENLAQSGYFSNNIESVTVNVFDVTESSKDKLIIMESDEDWAITLPDIDEISDSDFAFSIVYKKSDDTEGSIIPYSGDLIEGESLKTVYGRVRIDVIMSDNSWKITNQSSFFDQEGFGKTKKIRFDNTESFEVFHNLSNTPIVQSWVQDEFGQMQEANVSITHDWESENSFSVTFDSPQTGYILYI